MKIYDAKSIRNICLLSHQSVGKTSLLEAACFTSKGTTKMGKVDNGSSVFDARSDEKERKMTISMAAGFCEWDNGKINFLDTPGFLDFQGDAIAALRVVESALILVDAVDGIQVGTEIMSRHVESSKTPHLFFVNKIDKDNVDFEKTVAHIKESCGASVAPLTIPIGTGTALKGIVDLIGMQAYEYQREGNGIGRKIDIPANLSEEIKAMRQSLMESIAESDEELMNIFFDKSELTDAEMRQGLAKGVAAGAIFPLLCGSATQNVGIDVLLSTIMHLCPSAETRKEVEVIEGDQKKMIPCGSVTKPALAFVFKTLSEEHLGEINLVRVFNGKLATGQEYANQVRNNSERMGNMYCLRGRDRTDINEIPAGDIGGLLKLKDTHTNESLADKTLKYRVTPTVFPEPLFSVAIKAKTKGDDDKIGAGLNKLREEDPTFVYRFQSDIHQSILSGMGDVHIDILLDGLRNRFKVGVEKMQPKISYRETIVKSAKYIEYTHKKQTGGAGQYARVFIDLEPLPRGGGYEFVDKIVGGVIDQSFRPSVDKGVRAKLDEGIIAGYPIVDVRVSLVDGKTHPVDSKDIAFQVAGREVFKKAFEMCSPILLEPIMDLRATVPDDTTGDVMGDLSSRRGKIAGMEPNGKYQSISAKVPASEVQNYSQALRAITQGRGHFTKTFSHYDPVPPEVAKKIIEKAKAEQAQPAE
jgi:elongation factor G